MPQRNAGTKAFNTSAAIARGIRVTLAAAGTVSAAGAGVEGIGTSRAAAASGEALSVYLDNKSVEATASGAITAGNDCFPAASGAVSATVAGRRVGIALETVATGNLFEMMIAPPAS
ncbi:MAG TPA: hypothetical protein VMX74_05695 [Pirellulales bacterium]|nr:hypothetical protein [Pirellulales bacterium]